MTECRSSSTSSRGPESARHDASRAGTSAGEHAEKSIIAASARGSPMPISATAVTTADQSAAGSSPTRARSAQAAGCRRSVSHPATAVVLPYPAGAQTTVTGVDRYSSSSA
ncbi:MULTISPECIES: hypothetical protein [Gordonia]|uniref:hypothetical protein n=1 Tax=Gordonia TaxID=2053 RepID=UPI0005EF1F30|nr:MULTISPECIES: hypothetical protein [Gordonia]KJR07922.1 hypothetical protein UG54_09340 [Gordonia sihwensis]KXT58123.1 hypothetical protein Y710_04510 [Gordonia sp. QH-12]